MISMRMISKENVDVRSISRDYGGPYLRGIFPSRIVPSLFVMEPNNTKFRTGLFHLGLVYFTPKTKKFSRFPCHIESCATSMKY
jgi:hypothetical protein